MRKALIVLSSAKTEVLRCSRRFPTEDKLQELIIEIKNSISELQMSIAKLLKPMVATEGIELDNKYWISSDDIRSGYILLRKGNYMGATHVLFLRDHVDKFDNSTYKEGEIKKYNLVNHILERINAELALQKSQSKSKKSE